MAELTIKLTEKMVFDRQHCNEDSDCSECSCCMANGECLFNFTEERKVGKWIRKPIRNDKGGCIGAEMICSCCNKDNRHDEYMDFCPNCGAKMIGDNDGREDK